jgi:hypothetical protein
MHTRNWHSYIFAAVAIATLLVGATVIKVQASDSPPPAAVTIFINKGLSGSSVADALNKAHSEWYAKGYIFAAMDSYIEDGDLEGMWVTYTKQR